MVYLESFLEVMGHADLLQWFEISKQTGACSFVHGQKSRRLYLREGLIVAAESNEPHLLLGQFLISTGRLRPESLRESMMIHEQSGSRLGDILVDRGELSRDELQRVVTAKAEETVYGLFEWLEGSFRFVPGVEPPVDAMPVELHVQQVLLEGARRADEMGKALQALRSPNVVLHKTDRPVDAPTVASFMGHHLYDLIDGQRTLGELTLQCRTSPYHAYTFLARLVERNLLTVEEPREAKAALDERDLGDHVVSELQQLVEHEHYEAALDLIESHAIRAARGDILSMLIAKAEAGYIAAAFRRMMPPEAMPRRAQGSGSCDVVVRGDLTPEDLFLLEMIDGSWDVRSLVWISPLNKIDVIRGLIRLRDLGYIELHAPVVETGTEEKIEEEPMPEQGSLEALDQVIDDRIGGAGPPGGV